MTKKIYYLSIFIFLITVLLPFRRTYTTNLNPISISPQKRNITASSFEKSALKQEYLDTSNIDYKKSDSLNKDAPQINAKNALVVDIKNKKILYSKEEEQKVPIASLTKIMTAIIAVEHSELSKEFKVSKNAVNIGENSMGLIEGEQFTLNDLLYGLILNSGNDSAVTIAEGIAGNEQNFVDYMNKKATLLGANNTLFTDASGLNKYDKLYYSTAVDLAKISTYSLRHQVLKDIYKTVTKEIPTTDKHSAKVLENQTNLLTTYPGVKGIKTGFTDEAGLCLVSYAENNGQEIIVVILGSSDRRGDSILLLDYGFNSLGVKVEHNLLD